MLRVKQIKNPLGKNLRLIYHLNPTTETFQTLEAQRNKHTDLIKSMNHNYPEYEFASFPVHNPEREPWKTFDALRTQWEGILVGWQEE